MFELVRRLSARQLAYHQLPVLLLAVGIAETFYKFHSFLLETGAFLLTWFALDALHAALRSVLGRGR